LIYEIYLSSFHSASRSAAVPELWTLGVITFMTQNEPAPLRRERPPRYLTLAEWFFYFFICLGPYVAAQLMPPGASAFDIELLSWGVLLLGIVGLGIIMGRKHRYKL
jgi:hypothetical protein